MSIKKQFLKSKPVCKVTFKVSADDAGGATQIQILGDFNGWDKTVEPMKALKSGDFSQTIELESGKEYECCYLMDGTVWANEADSDSKVTNQFSEMNDVISTVQ